MKFRNIMLFIVVGILLFGGIVFALGNKGEFREISYSELLDKVNNKDTFVLCITKTDCPHCSLYKPKLEEASKKYKVDIYYLEADKLTVEDGKDLKKYFAYSGTPTTIFVIDGKEKTAANRLEGNVSMDKIESKLKNNGYIK